MMRNVIALVALVTIALSALTGHACPICEKGRSISDDLAEMDVAIIVRLLKVHPQASDDELAKAQFEVVNVIKGEKQVKTRSKLDAVYFGDGKPGSLFLLMGLADPKLTLGNPMLVSARASEYLSKLGKLPKDSTERLLFFQRHLEDEDHFLAAEAYEEFAKASYALLKEYKPNLNRDQLVKWIGNVEIPASHRRMYLMLLGICGSEKDLPMLEAAMKSKDRKQKAGLDALVACYLTLGGEQGLALVEDLFLKNPKSDYSDTYAAIMALRFHATEGGVLEKPRVTAALRHMLKRPELADLVIPDLAAAEDWTAAEELFTLFKTADERSTWVRVPVITFLRKCPTERAKEMLKECERLDPAAVKRANTFFPAGAAKS